MLAVGAELKSTAAWLAADQVTLSSHIGDVGSPETLEALTLATGQLEAMHHGRADVIACDLHPEYHSSRWAAERARQSGATLVRVQHHHAHLAALMAEHGLPGSTPILACTFDGTGWGTDGTVWGGEMLLGDCTGFTRVASLTPFPLPVVMRPCGNRCVVRWGCCTDTVMTCRTTPSRQCCTIRS